VLDRLIEAMLAGKSRALLDLTGHDGMHEWPVVARRRAYPDADRTPLLERADGDRSLGRTRSSSLRELTSSLIKTLRR
jgi:hypothetical protein